MIRKRALLFLGTLALASSTASAQYGNEPPTAGTAVIQFGDIQVSDASDTTQISTTVYINAANIFSSHYNNTSALENLARGLHNAHDRLVQQENAFRRELDNALADRNRFYSAYVSMSGSDPASAEISRRLAESRFRVVYFTEMAQRVSSLALAQLTAVQSAENIKSLYEDIENLRASIDYQVGVAAEIRIRLRDRERELAESQYYFVVRSVQSGMIQEEIAGPATPMRPLFASLQVRNPEAWLPALLPWPPPRPSGTAVIPADLLRLRLGSNPRLGAVDARLRTALSRAGYDEIAYYGVPGGFAMVTRLERIRANGIPFNGRARWSTSLPPLRIFSLGRYLSALFSADPGYFRVFVIIIADQPFSSASTAARFATLQNWSTAGFNVLPRQVSQEALTSNHVATVLVYEFRKTRGSRGESITPGRLTGRHHLRSVRLLRFLME